MSNHLHLIVQTENAKLSDIIRDFKKFTSKAIIKAIEDNKQESRKNWMVWIFKKAGEKITVMNIISFGSKKTIPYY